ncbi:MAG: hypothetical protein AB8G11_01955 [Saprospiraceae bacterium]
MAKERCKNCKTYATNLLMVKGSIAKYMCKSCKQEFCHQCKKGSHSCPKCGSSNTKRNGYISG